MCYFVVHLVSVVEVSTQVDKAFDCLKIIFPMEMLCVVLYNSFQALRYLVFLSFVASPTFLVSLQSLEDLSHTAHISCQYHHIACVGIYLIRFI